MMLPVEFTSSESVVRGYFFLSTANSVIATVIFLQGFPGIEGDELICEQLSQVGINVLTFNYCGTFLSEGYFSFSNAVDDIGAALRFLENSQKLKTYQVNPGNIILGGWSFGSAIVPAGAVQNPAFKRMFMISGRNFGKEARKIESDPDYAQQIAQNLESLCAPKGPVSFQDDLLPGLVANQDALDHEKLAPLLHDRRILLIGGKQDEVTPIEAHTIQFYNALANSGADAGMEIVQDDHGFLALFVQSDDIELIGIGASKRGGQEWFEGIEQVRDIIKSDWEFWGDVALDVVGAKISVKGEVAWLTTSGTLEQTDTFDEVLPIHLEQMTEILKAEDKNADESERLLEASHFGVRRLRERIKGVGYQWQFVISAILQKEANQWRFHTIHWSMPVD